MIKYAPGRRYQTAVGRRYLVLSSVGRVPAVPHCVTDRSPPVTVADPGGLVLGHLGIEGVSSLNSYKTDAILTSLAVG